MPDDRRLERQAADGIPSPPNREIPVGARVRIVSGAFAGKGGIAGSMDGKGGIVVALGQLSVRLLLEEIEVVPAAGRERPVLATSHVGKRAGKKAR
jgi:hypothetical protein